MIGTTLGRYDVLEKVGEGGMATVYRGRHHTLDRDVAIKVLHPHLSSSARNRERFAREARAIESLTHDNILEIHDYSGAEAADCWIVTEFVQGITLTELLNRCRRVPSEVAATIGIALADALGFAHREGVLHRDLKPDNVMIRRDGTIKLMDFGIARFLDESQVTMTGALVGSPAFMSPEQARESTLDGRSDLFSLGTLLFLLVTGEMPFQGSNPSVILRKIIEGDRDAVGDLAPEASGSFADVVERLLSPSPDDRYPDALAVRQALASTLDELGFDPAEPRWSLQRYLDDPDAWERDLDAFLRHRLLERARAALATGAPLVGLRLINRLLELQPEDKEALALLQDLHGGGLPAEEAGPSRRGAALWIAVALLVLLLPIGWWLLRAPAVPPPDPEPIPAEIAASPPPAALPTDLAPAASPTPEPASDATSPEPTPDPEPAAPPPQPSLREVRTRPSTRPIAEAPVPAAVRRASEPDPREEEAVTPAPPDDACVSIRARDAYAEIFLGGARVGHTRQAGCISVPAGTHTFALSGRGILDKDVELTLEPGETRTEVVSLVRRPVEMRFLAEFDDACEVVLDGMRMGTLAALGREIRIERPAQPHTVEVRCTDRTVRRTYSELRYLTVTFDGQATP